jgi:hypothetical protein
MNDQDKGSVVATILIKCDRGQEKWLRDKVRNAHQGTDLCLLEAPTSAALGQAEESTQADGETEVSPPSAQHEADPPACSKITLVDAAYCFGSFDFFLVIRAADAGLVEHFVVECLRSESRIRDTQTLVGIAIDPVQA